jgi:uncharacterized protein YkwD
MVRGFIALGLLGALALHGCATREAQGAGRTVGNAALERAIYNQVNEHRRTHGLTPLSLDVRIVEQARRHSAAMAAGRARFGHDGFDGRVKALKAVMAFRSSAENVASNRGHRDPAAEAVRGWLGSPAHRENIEGAYELTGVGVARSVRGEVFFTQMFVGR